MHLTNCGRAGERLPGPTERARLAERAGFARGTLPINQHDMRSWWWATIGAAERQGILIALVDAAIADKVIGPGLKRPFEELRVPIEQLEAQPSQRTQPTRGFTRYPPCPFGDTGRITDPARFHDREELLRQIFEELDKHTSLSLVGETQVGKSSVLSMICHYGPQRMTRRVDKFAILDLETVEDEDDFYETLCYELGLPETLRGASSIERSEAARSCSALMRWRR